jgi:Mor family transcriptional regulator
MYHSPTKIDRNKQVIADYLAGAEMQAIAQYYKISKHRIYAILRANQIQRNRKVKNEQNGKTT